MTSKTIVIIAGSPRKGGNSDILCDNFGKGAAAAGHTVEKVYLYNKRIGFCKACYACKKNGECVQEDDVEPILGKMLAADIIVLATPVYFYAMSGQLKTLIDRTLPRYYASPLRGKDFYFIATAADKKNAMERTIEGLRGFTDCLPEAIVKGVIYGEGVYEKGEVISTPAMEEAYQAGLNAGR